MKEIKFRAWDKVEGGMHRVVEMNFCGTYSKCTLRMAGDSILNRIPDERRTIHQVEIMQYTGLKDKNGKEIYEGDIVKYVEAPSIDDEPTVGRVNWIEHKCALMPQEIEENAKGGHYIAFWDWMRWIEIIGNIYENPELTKEKT